MLFRLSYVREVAAQPESNERASAVLGQPLSQLSHGRTKEPPAGIEPAPRPYKGRVLAVDTTEAGLELWVA